MSAINPSVLDLGDDAIAQQMLDEGDLVVSTADDLILVDEMVEGRSFRRTFKYFEEFAHSHGVMYRLTEEGAARWRDRVATRETTPKGLLLPWNGGRSLRDLL